MRTGDAGCVETCPGVDGVELAFKGIEGGEGECMETNFGVDDVGEAVNDVSGGAMITMVSL